LPSSRETYVHRLGRTARAGRSGEGVLLLCDYEKNFLTQTLKDLPIANITSSLPPLPTEGSVVAWFDAVQRVRNELDDNEELKMRAGQVHSFLLRIHCISLPCPALLGCLH
jgi:superfamily II DNA/RNA helicase